MTLANYRGTQALNMPAWVQVLLTMLEHPASVGLNLSFCVGEIH